MKKFLVCTVVLLMAAPVFAAKDEREEDRVKEAGTVLKEILNVPDDIPQDLLNKAECVVILPSLNLFLAIPSMRTMRSRCSSLAVIRSF